MNSDEALNQARELAAIDELVAWNLRWRDFHSKHRVALLIGSAIAVAEEDGHTIADVISVVMMLKQVPV